MKVSLGTGALLALALLVAGCGGGGGSGGGNQPPLQALDQNTLVVQMDQNGDDELDLITLDISESPFVILECLYGMPGGDFEDVSASLRGLAIDPAVSGALSTYMGSSMGDMDRTELDVTDTNGDPTKVVVFGIGGGDPNGLASLAQSVPQVRPSCAAPGDAVLIKGGGFGKEPIVLFGESEAEVLRSDENRIICRVPLGLAEGDVTIGVDGVEVLGFYVLAEGAPALVYVSTETATPGMLIFFVGARLEGATADFEDASGGTTPVDLQGGSRIAYLKVPADLGLGSYTIVIRNEAGDDTGPCSPVLTVVEPGKPTLTSIEPAGQLPGRPVVCKGMDLGPFGFCFLTWTGDDSSLFTFGFANGYDRVHTWVPGDAVAGATYDVTIDFADGSTTGDTGAVAYTVGTPPAPELTELEYDKGPPGSLVGIIGHGLVGGHYAWPTVHFTGENDVSTEALIYYAFGGYHGANDGGGHGDPGMPNRLQGGGYGYDNGIDQVVVEVPRTLADGDYKVTVTLSGQTSNALVFTVGDLPLTVTSMKPNKQGPYGPMDVVVIEGTGFGVPDYDFVIADGGGHGGANGLALFDPNTDPFENLFKVKVTWQGDGDPLEGYVLWHHDREILVFPPGGWEDPLPVGEYTVYVTVERDDGSTETVEAGIYTVHEKAGDGDGFFPFPMNGGMK